jgi:hypothetical protein
MKAWTIILIALLAGCISPQEKPPSAEVHFVSTNPLIKGCNNRTTVESRETCYVEVADSSINPGICDEIGTLRLRNLCLDKLGKKLADPTICMKITNDDWRRTNCISGSSK